MRSASENTATVRMPASCAARITRSAISPPLAPSRFLIGGTPRQYGAAYSFTKFGPLVARRIGPGHRAKRLPPRERGERGEKIRGTVPPPYRCGSSVDSADAQRSHHRPRARGRARLPRAHADPPRVSLVQPGDDARLLSG